MGKRTLVASALRRYEFSFYNVNLQSFVGNSPKTKTMLFYEAVLLNANI